MGPGIFIPYRADSPERVANRGSSQKYFEYLGYSPVYVDSDPSRPFSRGEARNRAVEAALVQHIEAVVICDVDCLPEPESIARAATAADSYGGIHYPFTHVRVNSPLGVGTIEDGHDGGCIVVNAEEYRAARGCAEFYGWGWEDKILLARYRTWFGSEYRHQGILNHLWHPPTAPTVYSSSDLWALSVCKRYEAAIGSIWEMEDLEASVEIWEDPANTLGARPTRPGW